MVGRASRGEREAWAALVERYSPLIAATGRRLRLGEQDIEDVGQHVWLRLVEYLPRLRTPEALPGWIVTTATREAYRILRHRRRLTLVDPTEPGPLDGRESAEPDHELLREDVRKSVRDGLAELKPRHRDLLLLLSSDNKVSYHEVSDRLGMPLGSIGPIRARSLDRLRKSAAVRELVSA